jgi:hypothetical protein
MKVCTNIVSDLAKKVIKLSKMVFMPDRYILEGVVVLQKTVHELHRKKMYGVLRKIDFEKAYDKAKWPFLQDAMCINGFDLKRCEWINNFVSHVSVYE